MTRPKRERRGRGTARRLPACIRQMELRFKGGATRSPLLALSTDALDRFAYFAMAMKRLP